MIPEVNQNPFPFAPEADALNPQTDMVPALVAQVFQEAPLTERGRLLEPLLKPLGLLSLAAVANGIFARITMDQGWYQSKVSAEDATRVDARDVIALVSHAQQVSVHAIDGLARVISASPVLASSAAAAMLLTLLHKQAKARAPLPANDFDPIA